MAHDVANFDQEVLEKSHETPVLVDFWAQWCGPCRALGPVLEKLAAESQGSWVLAKLNTDENPEISMRYGIRGIPAVKLFVDGEVAAEFTGALPEYAVRKWLDENLPSVDRGSLAQATSLLDQGRVSEAQALLEELDSDDAKLMLAQMIVFTDPTRARALTDSIDSAEPSVRSVVEAIAELAGLLSLEKEELPEGAGRDAFVGVLSQLRSGRFDDAAGGLVSLLQHDRLYGDDAVRRLGVALFTLLGPNDEVTRKHRRLFDMYLY